MKPKFHIDDIVKTADLEKSFSKSDTTNWSYKLYIITEIINDTISTYRIHTSTQHYNEALLKMTE